MTIINKLASSLNRRDEVPNIDLAKQISSKNDATAVKELIDNLSNKKKDIQNDCIKVLYEIGERKPSLIAAYKKDFLALLSSKNNRLQWGAMTALNAIVPVDPKGIYSSLSIIMAAADSGSVITRDNAVYILINLCSFKQYAAGACSLLIEQLQHCPVNQLPMYAEKAMPVINEKNKAIFIKTLIDRFDDFEKETQKKRVEKVLRGINN
jgi:23S rRNA maturation mini-RNase III